MTEIKYIVLLFIQYIFLNLDQEKKINYTLIALIITHYRCNHVFIM